MFESAYLTIKVLVPCFCSVNLKKSIRCVNGQFSNLRFLRLLSLLVHFKISNYTAESSGKSMLRAIFFVLTLMIGQNSVQAASIFNSEIVLDNGNNDMEKVAKKDAFIDVLVRASGQSNVLENAVIKKALPKVSEYITKIGYGNAQGERTIILNFDDNKIRKLLRNAKAYYWGTPRPEVLFWIVEDSFSHRKVIWDQSGSSIISEIKQQGKRRGLPVLTPIGDFDDIIGVSIPDLWGGFVGPIAHASARYKPTGVVVVKLSNHQLSWKFFPNAANISTDFPIEGKAEGSEIEMLTQLVNEISDYYVANFAVNLGLKAEKAQVLEISGLNSAEDFFALEQTLKSLNTVSSLRLDFVRNGIAVFNVNLLSSVKMFHNELNNERRLRLIGSSEGGLIDMPKQQMTLNEQYMPKQQDIANVNVSNINIPKADMRSVDINSNFINSHYSDFIQIDSSNDGGVIIYPKSSNEQWPAEVEVIKTEALVAEPLVTEVFEMDDDFVPDIRYQWMK